MKSGFSGVSYVVKNNHESQSLIFTQDCSVGNNIISHRCDLKATVNIPPNEAKVLHHLAPKTCIGGWQSGYSASYEWV